MKVCLFFIFFFGTLSVTDRLEAQGQEKLQEIRDCLENFYYGTNDLLVNGREYRPEHTRASGHPYFESPMYQAGTVYSGGEVFRNVLIKYDLAKDQLVLKHPLRNQNVVQIVLNPELVDSFAIADSRFVRSRYLPGLDNGPDYVKALYSGTLKLYQLLAKQYYPIFTSTSPNGRFGKAEVGYFLLYPDGSHSSFRTRSQFLEAFPEHKRSIRRFMRKQHMRWARLSGEQWNRLMKYCDGF
jgi:hypothetical protein